MNEILQANIFFFIASVATVVFCILVCIALHHFIKILRSVRAILERVEEGSEVLADDLANIREVIVNGGFISRIIGLFWGGSDSAPTKRKRKVTNRNNKTTYGNEEESEE